MKKLLLCLTTLIALPSCHRPSVTSRRTLNLKKMGLTTQPQTIPAKSPYVTIWIHGTRGFKPFDEIVHAAPPSSGLQPIPSLGNNYNRFKNMAKTIAQTDPIKYPLEHFYIFGWSGDLSFSVRRDAASQLHNYLEKLVATYTKKYGYAPFIRFITHSHGGNVALNLATIEHPNKEWFINEVILLACPVQHKTEKFIESPIFGKIYSFYSSLDTIQIADPQGFYKKECLPEDKGIFSQRRFPDHEKLVQIKLRLNNHGVPHSCFTLCNFLRHLPTVINSLDQWEEEEPHKAHEIRQLNVLL